jgi:hypothetical protein
MAFFAMAQRLFHVEMSLFHLREPFFQMPQELFHLELRHFHLPKPYFHLEKGLFHRQKRRFHLPQALFHLEKRLGPAGKPPVRQQNGQNCLRMRHFLGAGRWELEDAKNFFRAMSPVRAGKHGGERPEFI